jgi:hypothetical protein
VKTVQGMMRHATPQTTLGIYTQTVNWNMLTAQEMMYEAVWQNAPKIVHIAQMRGQDLLERLSY